MEITFKKLEFMLGFHFGVNEEREGAFRGRIQHLQRAKVPSGVNTGKGRAASYGWSQIIELITVLDLIDIGLSPEAARKVVGHNLALLFRLAASFGVGVPDDQFSSWIADERCPLEGARVIAASAGTLHALSGGEDIMFECMNGTDFAASIVDAESYQPASCFINLSKRLLAIMNYLRLSLPGQSGNAIGLEGIIADYRSWAASIQQDAN